MDLRTAFIATVALGLVACSPKSSNESDVSAAATVETAEQTPAQKFESMKPVDQVAFFQAFHDYYKAVENVPNSIAYDAVEKSENKKLCAVVRRFKRFKSWTAEVLSISKDDAGGIQLILSANGGLGYSFAAHIGAHSPFYPKVVILKDFLHGHSYVTVSGTVVQATERGGTISDATDDCSDADFDVKLTAINSL